MMQAKKLLGLLLVGCLLLSDGTLNATKDYKFVTGDRKGETVKIPSNMVLSGTGRAKDEKVYAYVASMGSNQGGNQGGNQNVTPPPPLKDTAPDFGPDFTDRIAKVDSEEAAVALALEILEYLTKDDNLQFKGNNIDSQRHWSNFQQSVNNNKSEIYGNKWQLNRDRQIVLRAN